MISLKNVSKWYGHFQVLTDCSTEVKKGDVVVVCGPSGSGKSTLIKTVNGLEPVQQGEIVVNGTKVNDKKTNLAQLRSHVGMVFQHFELFPHLSIIENLTLAQVKIPGWIATMVQPLSNANSFCAMLMVGMLMDLPQSKHDVKEVMAVIAWRIPFSVAFALIAWFLLPFSASIRAVMVICALAPIAIFSTLFTDKVLGNAKLAGFSLAITAMISLVMMAVAHALMGV